ncbi:ABC transporter permease [Thermococcus waiotapuensis]|uniref:ABC transporter permease n=1 Tax=Thermococcus waiotapuensis TaxID=90909 RepID=A0AAE4SYM8_9EURY|nr:ABC transporter permease subunit [Thermococcus waiotapuensis]MDV3103899.1 ABC transporter permease [Thermococcus waiotapuensis]
MRRGWLYLFLFALASWMALARLYPMLIPGIGETLAFYPKAGYDLVLESLLLTLYHSLWGFIVAFGLTWGLILLALYSKEFRAFLNSLNIFIQSVSVLVWTIIFIMIFGVTSSIAPILVTAMAAFPALLSAGISSSENLIERYRPLIVLLKPSKPQLYWHFIAPGTLPEMVSASRVAIGIALRISVVAEAFGSAGGIGYQLIYSYDLGVKAGVFAWALLLVVLMVTIDQLLLRRLEEWVRRWYW